MADQVKGTEEFFLKLVKQAILAIMALALAAIPLLLVVGAANFMSQPKEPAPAKKAPAKAVTMDGMSQYLEGLQKGQEEAEKSDPSKKKASELDPPPAIYLVDAVTILTCTQKFAVNIGAEIDANTNSTTTSNEAVRLRDRIESDANMPGRGAPYVKSLSEFVCKALAKPDVIAIKKSGKFKGSIVGAIFSYHQLAWDGIVNASIRFEADEQARVLSEREAEAARIDADRWRARAAFTGAGSAFAIFMLLAIYLILAKIETNLREINGSIRTHGGRQVI